MVPEVGVEPTRPYGQRILNPSRLPFRHSGIFPRDPSADHTVPAAFATSWQGSRAALQTRPRGTADPRIENCPESRPESISFVNS